jgi:signal transduction histidine kinase
VDGLGLGLFITKELVTAHGGSITASSVVGQGAIFIMRLPLVGAEDHHAPASARVSERKPTSRRSRTQ